MIWFVIRVRLCLLIMKLARDRRIVLGVLLELLVTIGRFIVFVLRHMTLSFLILYF